MFRNLLRLSRQVQTFTKAPNTMDGIPESASEASVAGSFSPELDHFLTDGVHVESDFDTADSGPRVEPVAEKPKRKPYKRPRIKREKAKNKTPYLGIRIAIQLRRGLRGRVPMKVIGVPGGLERFRLVYAIVLVRSLMEQYYAIMAPDKHEPRNHNKLLAFIRSSRLRPKDIPDAATLDIMIAYVDQLDLSWYAKMPLGRAVGEVIGLQNKDRLANKMHNIWPEGATKTTLRNEHNARAAADLRRKRLGLRPDEEDKLKSLCIRPNERLEFHPDEDVDGEPITHPLIGVSTDAARERLRIIRRRASPISPRWTLGRRRPHKSAPRSAVSIGRHRMRRARRCQGSSRPPNALWR